MMSIQVLTQIGDTNMLTFLDFTETPRSAGNPSQIIINKEAELRNFFFQKTDLPVITPKILLN